LVRRRLDAPGRSVRIFAVPDENAKPPLPHLPRPPSFSPGLVSFFWGLGLGLYVWLFLWAVGVGKAVSILFGIICGTLIFFAVLVYGDTPLRRGGRR
jgi:hypothetical protein